MEKFAHGGNVYDGTGKKKSWIDMSANINPLGIPPSVRQVLQDHLEDIVYYPDPAAEAFKRAVYRHYRIEKEYTVAGNGAAELLYVWFHAYRPATLVLPVPSFNEYGRAALAGGAAIQYIYLSENNEFAGDWEKIAASCPSGSCLILGNPNNPTGTLINRDTAVSCVRICAAHNVFVIIDESFLDFRDDGADYTVLDLVRKYDNLLVLRSLTKFYALPGLRLAFAAAAETVVARMEAHKDCWNVNVLAQLAGAAALRDNEYARASIALIKREAAFLKRHLSAINGVRIFGGTVNFILIKLERMYGSATACVSFLEQEGILLRNCSNYEGLNDRFLRIAVKDRKTNEIVIKMIKKYFNNDKIR